MNEDSRASNSRRGRETCWLHCYNWSFLDSSKLLKIVTKKEIVGHRSIALLFHLTKMTSGVSPRMKVHLLNKQVGKDRCQCEKDQ